jgi:transposase
LLAGQRNDEIACHESETEQWRRRFAARGIAGLRDEPRPGKPAKYGAELRDRIMAELELAPRAGMASWDGVLGAGAGCFR